MLGSVEEPLPPPQNRSVFGRFVAYVQLAMLASLFYVGRQAYFAWKMEPPPVEADAPALSAPPRVKLRRGRQENSLTIPPDHIGVGEESTTRSGWLRAPQRHPRGEVDTFHQAPIAADSPALLRGDQSSYGGHAVGGYDPRVLIFWMLGAFVVIYAILTLSLRAGVVGKRQPLTHD